MSSYYILGLDPGTTTAAAYLSYTRDAWDIEEGRGLSPREIIRHSLERGIIIALATDKARPPVVFRKLKAWLGVPIITPRHDLTREEKRRLLPTQARSLSHHAFDALAAAFYAKRILTRSEEAEARRYAHHGMIFTPQDFFKAPRKDRDTSLSSPEESLRERKQTGHSHAASHRNTPPQAWQEERQQLIQRIQQLTRELRETEARAAYYQHLARRIASEEPKSSIHTGHHTLLQQA